MIIMAVAILPVILIAPFLPKLITRFGKKKLTVYSSLLVIVLSVIQYYAGYQNLVVFLVIAAARVLAMQVPMMLYGMFTADCIEYGAYVNGERTEGIAFSLQTFVTKLGGAFCNSLCLVLLAAFGYVGKTAENAVVQTTGALNGIWFIMSIVPIFGFAVMLVIMAFYKLDEKIVAEMMDENHKKRKA